MKKTTNTNPGLSFEKEGLSRMNRDQLETVSTSDLDKATGGYSLRCPNCALSSTTYGQSAE